MTFKGKYNKICVLAYVYWKPHNIAETNFKRPESVEEYMISWIKMQFSQYLDSFTK